jgi:hypothetical protein
MHNHRWSHASLGNWHHDLVHLRETASNQTVIRYRPNVLLFRAVKKDEQSKLSASSFVVRSRVHSARASSGEKRKATNKEVHRWRDYADYTLRSWATAVHLEERLHVFHVLEFEFLWLVAAVICRFENHDQAPGWTGSELRNVRRT